jgi:hypothetical protein
MCNALAGFKAHIGRFHQEIQHSLKASETVRYTNEMGVQTNGKNSWVVLGFALKQT